MCAIGEKHLHPIVLPVGDIDVALAIQAQAPGPVELALTIAVPSPSGQERAVPGECLHAVVETVDNVELEIAAQQIKDRLGSLALVAVAVVRICLNAFSHFEAIGPS
ncbi:hypothetical protein NKDENANG_01691 [Candidatus Entotheonellaceae bacterium PAL068K]